MTRREAATIGAAVALPVWLVVALAFRDWPPGILLWPVVFLGGLVAVRLAAIALQREPSEPDRPTAVGLAKPRKRRHFPLSGALPGRDPEDETSAHPGG